MATLYVSTLDELQEIRNEHFDFSYQMPAGHKYYNVDLNKREINAPVFLSTLKDHRAEHVFFRVPRYFDNIDLTAMTCIIQFINADKEKGVYLVPHYDIKTEEGFIYIPWIISGLVSKSSGIVEYSISFYYIDENNGELVYNLNTKSAKSTILIGMDLTEAIAEENGESVRLLLEEMDAGVSSADFVKYVSQVLRNYEDKLDIYWEERN